MNKSTNIITLVIAALGILVIGLGIGYLLFDAKSDQPGAGNNQPATPLYYRHPMNPTVTSPIPAKDEMGMDYVPVYAESTTAPAERKILFYRSPMNPDVTSSTPAKDTMGMDYVPVYEDAQASDVVGTVRIDPVVVQNIGVRTAKAVQRAMSRNIRAVGRVDFDEELMVRLHPKVEGWIEEIRVDKTGQQVAKDDILLSIYSPKLVSTQQEYLLALNNFSALQDSPFEEISKGAEALVHSSRERLRMMDVAEHQIRELQKTRKVTKNVHIHSPVAGTAIRIGARQGQYVSPMTELYMLVDLSQVWVYADVYEYELPWVNVGDQVEMTLASVPGKTFTGTLAYIYPYAESTTRTTKVRLVFDNADLLLRPDMLADVSIKADTRDMAIVIPAEAVVRSGGRTQVFVVRGAGKFEPRVVELGIESEGQVAVLNGVQAGETVVTSAQFLLDSESKLREATAKMLEALSAGDQADPAEHDIESATSEGEDAHTDHVMPDTATTPAEQAMDDMPALDHSEHDAQNGAAHPAIVPSEKVDGKVPQPTVPMEGHEHD